MMKSYTEIKQIGFVTRKTQTTMRRTSTYKKKKCSSTKVVILNPYCVEIHKNNTIQYINTRVVFVRVFLLTHEVILANGHFLISNLVVS